MFKRMYMNRRVLSIILSMFMIFTIIPFSASAAEMTDVSNHWAQDTIESWVDRGLTKGYPDGSFKPDNNITRAEFATMVNRAFGYTLIVPISYPDVKVGAWYYNSIEIAVAAGYISGYPDGTMKPENPITREEAAALLTKMNKLTENKSAANIFTDAAKFSWSKGAIGAVVEKGLMGGYPDGSFGNRKFITRGEAVVVLDRNLKHVKEPIDPTTPVTPPAPAVTRNDTTNTVTGMLATMEYKLDSGKWAPYISSIFEAIDFSGNHTLLVRYAASGINPVGPETTLTFTTNVVSGGGGGGGGGGSTSPSTVAVSGITVTGAGGATTITTDNGTLQMLADVQPATATTKNVTWSVINGTDKATISTAGLLQAVADGQVTVKATAKDGSGVSGQLVVSISGQELEPVVADQPAPTTLAGVAPTPSGGNDGKITGTTTDMEYKLLSDESWIPVTGAEITGLAAGWYKVRYAAKPGYNAGNAVTVAVGVNQDQNAPTGLVGVAPTLPGGSDGQITGTTADMEYRLLEEGTSWIVVTGSTITGLETGFYDVRYAARPGYNEGIAATVTVGVGAILDQAAPVGLGVVSTPSGVLNGKITGTTTDMEYRLLQEGTPWIQATELEITGLAAGWYDVRYAAKPGYNAGAAATVTVGENLDQNVPTTLAGVAPTLFGGSDGQITGATIEMEYKLKTDCFMQ